MPFEIDRRRRQALGALLLSSALSSGCIATSGTPAKSIARAWSDSGQLVLVTTADWNASTGQLQTFSRKDGRWIREGKAEAVTIGRSGSAWGIGLHDAQPGPVKREGDGRAPAGVFRIGPAFGYAQTGTTSMPYLPMAATHHCVDVSGSPLYNRIVDTREVGSKAVEGSTEPMRRDIHANGDLRYKSGLVIEHNSAGVPEGGSCIFAHLWKAPGEATAGCTAMHEDTMARLQTWLKPTEQPVFVLLPEVEFKRLQLAWQLPAADAP